MTLWGQSMNSDPVGPQISFVKSMKPTPLNNDSDRQFLTEASRKRKAMDVDLGGSSCSGVSLGYLGNYRGNLVEMPCRDSDLQHNPITPLLSDSHWRSSERFFNHNLQSVVEHSVMQPPVGNYHFYSMSIAPMSMRPKGGTLPENASDGFNSSTFHRKDPFLPINTPNKEIPKLTDAKFYVNDTANQSESGRISSCNHQSCGNMEKSEAALRYIGMNTHYGDYNLPGNPYACSMMPQNLPFSEMLDVSVVSRNFDSDGRSVQNLSKTGLFGARTIGKNLESVEDNSTIKGITNSQTSVAGIESVRYGNHPCDNNIGAHLNVSCTNQNLITMLHVQKPAESSACEEKCLNNERLKMDSENKSLEKDDSSRNESGSHSLKEGEKHAEPSGLPSNLGEQKKSDVGNISPVVAEKLWEGILQLNTSTTVSAVAYFKSGEKAQDINWSEHVEIKGKVRLQAFENFIQELPRSRNRALMVISLRWKVGSSKSGLVGMKEVAKGYEGNKRVGFAQICPGYDVYVCPRSESITTILAKYGFIKGMVAEEDQDSLIGCVVWRRNQPSANSVLKKTERKRNLECPTNSPDSTVPERRYVHSKLHDSDTKQATACSSEPNDVPGPVISDCRSTIPDSARHTTNENMVIQSSNNLSNHGGSKSNDVLRSAPLYPYTSPIVPVQLPSAQISDTRSLQETVECTASLVTQTVEGRKPGWVSQPMPSILSQSVQMFPEIHQRNIQFSSDSHNLSNLHSGPVPQLAVSIPFESPLQPQREQKPDFSTQQDPRGRSNKAEIPDNHFEESKKHPLNSELTLTTLPGPPPLPPEILQRLIQSRRSVNKEPNEGISKAETPIRYASERNIASRNIKSTRPSHAGPPPSLPQTMVCAHNLAADDDLPEFDFDSACGVLENPVVSKCSSSSHQFSDSLPSDVGGSASLGLPTLRKMEATRTPKASSFTGESPNTYQGTTLLARFEERNPGNRPAAQTSYPLIQPYALKAENNIAGPRSKGSFSRNNCWNDDDDMPEWCPPDLEHLDQPPPSTIPKLSCPVFVSSSDIAVPHPSVSVQFPSFRPPQTQGFVHRNQLGILGPPPACSTPITVQTQSKPVAHFVHTSPRPPLPRGPNPRSRPCTSKFNIRPSSDAGWRS